MTFEPIDDDEYETAATRPRTRRAGRRAVRRRYAILGVLAEHGPCTALDLCLALHVMSGTLYPDLALLEHEVRVVSDWDPGDDHLTPRRRLYRLPSPQEAAHGT